MWSSVLSLPSIRSFELCHYYKKRWGVRKEEAWESIDVSISNRFAQRILIIERETERGTTPTQRKRDQRKCETTKASSSSSSSNLLLTVPSRIHSFNTLYHNYHKHICSNCKYLKWKYNNIFIATNEQTREKAKQRFSVQKIRVVY